MALARVKVWNPGDILTASDLNGEFNNVLNNPITLISPLTANISAGGNQITNLVIEKVAANPVVGTTGRIYFNTNSSALQVDSGKQIQTLDSIRRITALSSSQTWTRSSDVSKVWLQLIGGGGGGGASSTTAAGNLSAGGGGGGGGFVTGFISLTSSMTTATITVNTTAGGTAGAAPGGTGGTGGSVSWADGTNTLTANGGVGGGGSAMAANTQVTAFGGGGGSASGGSVNVTGAAGVYGLIFPSANNTASGQGAATLFGAGGASADRTAGNAGLGFGGGGSGAGTGGNLPANGGGTGTPGLVLIYELG